MSVAAASAAAVVGASTVTASAMPKEKLRPSIPLVAMPRIGISAEMVALPSSRPLCNAGTSPTFTSVSGVRIKAISPPSLTYALSKPAVSAIASQISSATAPATAAIGVTKLSACGMTAATIRFATLPVTAGRGIVPTGWRKIDSSLTRPARSPWKRFWRVETRPSRIFPILRRR